MLKPFLQSGNFFFWFQGIHVAVTRWIPIFGQFDHLLLLLLLLDNKKAVEQALISQSCSCGEEWIFWNDLTESTRIRIRIRIRTRTSPRGFFQLENKTKKLGFYLFWHNLNMILQLPMPLSFSFFFKKLSKSSPLLLSLNLAIRIPWISDQIDSYIIRIGLNLG